MIFLVIPVPESLITNLYPNKLKTPSKTIIIGWANINTQNIRYLYRVRRYQPV